MIFLRVLVAILVAWLGLGSPAEASPLSDVPVAVYTYDAPVCNAPGAAVASQRGPPAVGFADATTDAGDRWSRGPSARPAGAMPSATYTYDHPVLPVQVASGTSMTLGRAGATAGLPSPLEPSGVAANAVDDLPTVNWGQQSKHFPGHPNFIPGRSTLTANPEVLIQRAGTGTPVGSVPRGQAGFKERIDFGDNIGTYVSRDGTSSPTSVGILHYRVDGSVHIIPGRPQ